MSLHRRDSVIAPELREFVSQKHLEQFVEQPRRHRRGTPIPEMHGRILHEPVRPIEITDAERAASADDFTDSRITKAIETLTPNTCACGRKCVKAVCWICTKAARPTVPRCVCGKRCHEIEGVRQSACKRCRVDALRASFWMDLGISGMKPSEVGR